MLERFALFTPKLLNHPLDIGRLI